MKSNIKIPDSNLKTSPGTLKYVGRVVDHTIKIKIVEYDEENYSEKTINNNFGEIVNDPLSLHKTWINVDGIHQAEVIQEIGHIFGLHPLLLEDVLNTNQKPKVEYYGENILYFTFKSIEYNDTLNVISSEHVSFVLGPNFLISFQEEGSEDKFAEIYHRLKGSIGKIRKYGTDYLMFSLIDLEIDNYVEVIQKIDDGLDVLEESIINNHREKNQNQLYGYKREISALRKITYPVRDMLNSIILYSENELIRDATKLYFRDAQDHASQVVETLDSNREMVASLMDLHLSQVSNKMNNVMKVLTVISVIFMPLTFIVGVYGMNFDNMPELHWRYGYFMIIGVIFLLTIMMLIFFRKKGWLY
jgi:magnesium transporter